MVCRARETPRGLVQGVSFQQYHRGLVRTPLVCNQVEVIMEFFTNMVVTIVALYDSGWYHFVNMDDIRNYMETLLLSKGMQ